MVGALTTRRASRSGALWGLAFGVYVIASAVGYATTYPTAAARARLAASLGASPGLAALIGPARHIDTVAGFTAWRSMGVLSIVGAVWALLLATRMIRGEEDSGRWELYLCGQTTRGRAAAQAIAGLSAGLVALWALTALLTAAAGTSARVRFSTGGSLYLATCLVAGAAMALALGAALSELAASRRQANTIGAAVLGAMYLIRMVADSTAGLAWLRWTSPFGWIEELRPLVGPRPLALLPIAALTLALASSAIVVAGRRDLGASALAARDARPARTALLGSPLGLAMRQAGPVLVGWAVGMVVFGLVLGLIANAVASAIAGSSTIQQAIARLGGHANGVKAYLGFVLVDVAGGVTFAAAGQISATRAEEESTRLDNLLVRPVSRPRWLAGRLTVAAGFMIAISILAGFASWLGTLPQGGGAPLGQLLAAGINVAPPAIFVLGVGAVVYGVAPRAASIVTYAVAAWSLLVDLIAPLVTSNRVVIDSSVLAHISPAPAADPNWVSAGWLVGLGVLAAGAGVIAFGRRDLAGE